MSILGYTQSIPERRATRLEIQKYESAQRHPRHQRVHHQMQALQLMIIAETATPAV